MEERELWSFSEGEEPERGRWTPCQAPRWWQSKERPGLGGILGETLHPTRAEAIRHALQVAQKDRDVLEKALFDADAKVDRLYALMAVGDEE